MDAYGEGVITNNQLFSHTYLAQLQADASRDEVAAPLAQELRHWLPFRDTSSLSALMESWVGPVLDFLRFHHVPDKNAPHIRELYAHRRDEFPVGLCYVVPVGQDLNETIKGRHPMAQAVLALRARDLRWGILTDGSRWRLLDAKGLRRYEHYVEVDLDALVDSEDPTPLRLFYAFFHRSAFAPNTDGENGLDKLVTASTRATKAAEDHLKARISHNEGIMAQLCMGLVRADGKNHYSETERDAIYRDATYLLYRMLFILYAEARGLLPMESAAYREASLTKLVETARSYRLQGIPDSTSTVLWDRLSRLCNAVYESDVTLGIPAYNGGLFDDADKPYLRRGQITDVYLSRALFDLAYRFDGGAPDLYQPIDYRDLSVRHLGSIYEGMIEYKLQIAEEPLWARRDRRGNVRFLRTGQEGAPRKTDEKIEAGQVYFSQSPGERRATGTYYTPEYVVDHIVRQTVGRGLAERRESLEGNVRTWLREIDHVTDLDALERMQRYVDEELLRFIEEQVLSFFVCDPAMGSGHFLVNAAHHITNFVVETFHLTSWFNNAADVDPVVWRRRVVERCLFGVDLSLMAVELAKLSLWLASVAEGKPLSFLDHHLRQGNSLIGTRLEELSELKSVTAFSKSSRRERRAHKAGQLSMLDEPAFRQHLTSATDLLGQIAARVADTVDDIKSQAADYEQVRAELEPYRKIADLWTAHSFGLGVEEEQIHTLTRYLINGTVSPVPEYQRLLAEVQKLSSENHFFHWELEFPLVFDHRRSHSFCAIIGNPPWGYLRALPSERMYWERTYAALQAADTFALFVERALQLLMTGALFGMILPSGWQTANSGLPLRRHLAPQAKFLEFVNLPYDVFPDAYVDAMTMVLQVCELSEDPSSFQSGVIRKLTYNRRENVTGIDDEDKRWEIFDYGIWFSPEIRKFHGLVFPTFVSAPELPIFRKALRGCVKLGDVAIVQRGISPFHLVDGTKSSQHFPALDGELRRYRYTYTGKKFVEYHDGIAEFKPRTLFTGTRVLVRQLISRQFRLQAVCADEFFLNNQSIQVVKSSSEYTAWYLVAVINSRFLSHYHLRMSALALRDDFPKIVLDDTRSFPVPLVQFVTHPKERELQKEQTQKLYQAYLLDGSMSRLLELVDDCVQTLRSPQSSAAQNGKPDARNGNPETLSFNSEACTDIIHDVLAYLAQQMMSLNHKRQRLARDSNLFRFVEPATPCVQLHKALGSALNRAQAYCESEDPTDVHHDIEGLRLNRETGGQWLLGVRAKMRDPESRWRKHQRDQDGNFIRKWLPVYRLQLDDATGTFYHYAFRRLDGFDGAGSFPGGSTRSMLTKLQATMVPEFVPVDLTPLTELEAELAEVKRRIRLTDDLIDQIVYKVYGLTEEEIAIVEGRA